LDSRMELMRKITEQELAVITNFFTTVKVRTSKKTK